ncbi:MAG: hypothetical protein ACK2T0_11025 [Anaerolineales bacterium]
MPSAQTRSETKSPTGEIFRLNFHGLKGQDLPVLWWIMPWLGQNSWEPVGSVLYSNLVGGDASHGAELYYQFRRVSGSA